MVKEDEVSEGKKLSYKYSGTNGGQICDFHIHKRKIFDINISAGRKYDSHFLTAKKWEVIIRISRISAKFSRKICYPSKS